MIPVIGIIVVFGCIAGGYLMERGNMLVLIAGRLSCSSSGGQR